MRVLFFCLALYGALIIFSELASAQDGAADPAAIERDWVIQPYVRDNGVPSGECMMTAIYNNGFAISFKGKDRKLTAMRISDVSGDNLSKVNGFIGLGLDNNSYGLQSKNHEGQVDASLLNVPAAAEILGDLSSFRIRMGKEDFYFATTGFAPAYDRLIGCQGGSPVTTLKVVDSVRDRVVPVAPVKQVSKPVEVEEKVNIVKVESRVDAKIPSAPVALKEHEKLDTFDAVLTKTGAFDAEKAKKHTDVPLAAALPMLIPSGYSYHFDGRIDSRVLISWEESKDWVSDLSGALSPYDYKVAVEGMNVTILKPKPVTETVVAAVAEKTVIEKKEEIKPEPKMAPKNEVANQAPKQLSRPVLTAIADVPPVLTPAEQMQKKTVVEPVLVRPTIIDPNIVGEKKAGPDIAEIVRQEFAKRDVEAKALAQQQSVSNEKMTEATKRDIIASIQKELEERDLHAKSIAQQQSVSNEKMTEATKQEIIASIQKELEERDLHAKSIAQQRAILYKQEQENLKKDIAAIVQAELEKRDAAAAAKAKKEAELKAAELKLAKPVLAGRPVEPKLETPAPRRVSEPVVDNGDQMVVKNEIRKDQVIWNDVRREVMPTSAPVSTSTPIIAQALPAPTPVQAPVVQQGPIVMTVDESGQVHTTGLVPAQRNQMPVASATPTVIAAPIPAEALTPTPVVPALQMRTVSAATSPIPVNQGSRWEATAGERLEDVLYRWAAVAGVNTRLELANDPVLIRDFTFVGPFEKAVNGLLQDVSANSVVKPSAVIDYGSDGVSHVSGYQGNMMVEPKEANHERWRALQGSDLRKVLKRWSIQNGSEFIWDADQSFYLPQSVNATTDYVDAVALILSLFEGQPVRPTAILNNDPETGMTTLVVRSVKGLD